MDKIMQHHLTRAAYIYIRQSTLHQVHHHKESQRVQYGLANRAKVLGWKNIQIIDDDLGISGTGKSKRPGFEKLLAEVCKGTVGAIFAMEASRLARNGREWHTLLDLCCLVKTLIIDLDTIYDPMLTNDRLLLGMKGTLSEMEISLFKQRSQEAIRQKAARGEFYTSIAIGYLVNGKHLEKDPDQRIQQAISLVFKKFIELASVRQVLLWFRQENITLPVIRYNDSKRIIIWRMPVYNTILKIITNPIYAGCYVYGRTITQTKIENGQRKVIRGALAKQEDWQVLIKDHHESYISWKQYELNQKTITNNSNMKGAMVRGSVKKGQSLLSGMIRCARCGRKMLTNYVGTKHCVVRYQCKGALQNHGTGLCISFGGLRVDDKVSEIVLKAISPLGLEASLKAIQSLSTEQDEKKCHQELSLKQARYEAQRLERQYNAVEPENRLVAEELERRWEKALDHVKQCEETLASYQCNQQSLTEEDKISILTLGKDIESLWHSKATSITFKKRIIRVLINEIIADVEENKIKLVIYWQGGCHTKHDVKKNKTGHHRFVTSTDTTTLIENLSRYLSDTNIASLLTRLGKKTGKGLSWNASRVRTFRNDHKIPVYKKNEHHERGELLVTEVCKKLSLPNHTVIRLIKCKRLPAKQVCKGAPWIIKEETVNEWEKQKSKSRKIRPLTENAKQETLDLSTT